MYRAQSTARLSGPFGFSVLLHASLIAAAFFARPGPPKARPDVYAITLIAAPPGERAIGTTDPTPAPTPPPTVTPPPPRAATNPKDMPAPTKVKPTKKPPAPATPTPPTKSAPKDAPLPKAGGGPTGGAGTDVANIKTEGVQFFDQAYLNNIVRQIAVRFKPRNPGALRAEVFFIVNRDGSITGFQFRTKSNVYAFDLEAQGAVESAGSAKAFGALPPGYVNDFLPVIFSFDPSLIR